jgi:hypothetical protein
MKWGKLLDDVLEGFESHWIDSLGLQRLHEALGLCVVVGIASAPHGAEQTMVGKELPIDLGGILRAADYRNDECSLAMAFSG